MTARVVLAVDMVRCDGHGICAWLFPAGIDLDEWGFALADGSPIDTRRNLRAAQRAVRACPRRALSLVPAPEQAMVAVAGR